MKSANLSYYFRILVLVIFGVVCVPKEGVGAAGYDVAIEKKIISKDNKLRKKVKKKMKWLIVGCFLSGIASSIFLLFFFGFSIFSFIPLGISVLGTLFFLDLRNRNHKAAKTMILIATILNLALFGVLIYFSTQFSL
jgi:RsiW-degrading membrane proteinase PrsW (M82 family)